MFAYITIIIVYDVIKIILTFVLSYITFLIGITVAIIFYALFLSDC